MPKNLNVSLRVRLTAHSTSISNVILLGYQKLSDGAKLTYMVLESYDWPDENGLSKGKCWPTIDTLATARGKSYDTIARHLKELEASGLIRIESGQEQGKPNCYWLLEPASDETEAYMARYSKKPLAKSEQPLQNCDTELSKNTVLPSAQMLDKESQTKKSQVKKDSNPTRSQPITRSQSPYLTRLMDDFSQVLNDKEHTASNRSQINNLFGQSGMDEQTFSKLLYEAKKRTQWAALANATTASVGHNRGAYFFQVVRDLLSERSQLTNLHIPRYSSY